MPHKRLHSGIYCFENMTNGKKYIGQAYNLERRLYEHEYYLARGDDKCSVLQRAVNKYGRDNFSIYILEYCEPEELNDKEIFYIAYHQSNNPEYGYNLSAGGGQGLLGYKFPPKVGAKISLAKKGKVIVSDETKRKMSIAQKGRFVSEETKHKISAGLSGENHYLWGKHHTEESKQKMSESRRGENSHRFGKKNSRASSQYFGVSRQISKNIVYWKAEIKIRPKHIYIGHYKEEIDAAMAYDAFVVEQHLPNPLNFPEHYANQFTDDDSNIY